MTGIAILIVVITVISVQLLDQREEPWVKRILNWLPAILFAYIIPAICTHTFGLDLSAGPIHRWSRDLIIPLALLMVMSALSFRQLKLIGVRPIVVFVSGSAAVATLPLVLVMAFKWADPGSYTLIIEEGYWKGLVPIVGSWIGGSTSQLVLKEVVACPEGLFLTILVLDNILINIWTILMFQAIKRSDQLNHLLGIRDPAPDLVADETPFRAMSVRTVLPTLLISALCIVLVGLLVDAFLAKVIIFSVLGLVLGNALRFWHHGFVLKAGGLCIVLIMAILGLKLDFSSISIPSVIVLFAVIWLLLHYVV
ncbi:MAG: DUF819 family protein, partial [Saprospiraceae bacterium]|nr:DUF819 family protein [Saprospiraceae bacterium]